jgi:glycosyltransferase involved in cell wall biosynthesis
MPQKILITGKNFDEKYNRTLILIKGFQHLGYEVIIFNYQKSTEEAAAKIRQLSKDSLFTFLPSFMHKSVKFVKKNSVSPVVFDPLISKYLTYVVDYKRFPKWSYGGIRTYLRDKIALKNSDFIIFDTHQHQSYFNSKYKIDLNKTGVVYIGTNNENFFKTDAHQSSKFIVGFIGSFIPLQGVMKIMKAIKLLASYNDIEFELIGKGHDFPGAKNFAKHNNLSNVNFLETIGYTFLNEYINKCSVCLGIFGDSLKTQIVIPNKIFNYSSCAKAIITLDTPAIRECFTNQKDIYLVNGTPESIADAVLALKADPVLRTKIETNVHELALQKFNEIETAQSFLNQFFEFKKQDGNFNSVVKHTFEA